MKKEQVIYECGCWQCPDCDYQGLVMDQTSPFYGERCESCQGYGVTKLCPDDAERNGWLK